MNFMSDNAAGAAPEILAALARVNDGVAAGYGGDDVTARVTEKLSALFEKKVAVFPVATGTAANSLAVITSYSIHYTKLYEPLDYAKTRKSYPVVYMLDADYSFAIVRNVVQHFVERDDLPPMILVAIAYPGAATNRETYKKNRTRDYTPVYSYNFV